MTQKQIQQRICTSCAYADSGFCPSYPTPVGPCEQYRRHKEAVTWWSQFKRKTPGYPDGD